MASHTIATADINVARGLSDLLLHAVVPGTLSTYSTGFSSLAQFCSPRGLQSMPVDAISLCAWMSAVCPRLKPKSVAKYISGIRWAHLMNGLQWTLSGHPLVRATMRALQRKFPASNKLHKFPMSVTVLLKLCRLLRGWPVLRQLDYNDLLWACASSVAVFAALRGGEFFKRKGATRPVLLRSMVRASTSEQPLRAVFIEVPAPKTAVSAESQTAVAASPCGHFELDPWVLWREYDKRRLELHQPRPTCPAFQLRSGRAMDGEFMLGIAGRLCQRGGVEVLNHDGSNVPVRAASWRAGYVLSARDADISEQTIDVTGRWKSSSGSAPYTFLSGPSLHKAASRIAAAALRGVRSAAGGRFYGDSMIL